MQFIECSYTGECTSDGKRPHHYGEFTFSNGDKYVGEFKDGVMHGNGVIFYRKVDYNNNNNDTNNNIYNNIISNNQNTKNINNENNNNTTLTFPVKQQVSKELEWDGQYRGIWRNGVNVSGCYVFADGLVYGGDAESFNECDQSYSEQKWESVPVQGNAECAMRKDGKTLNTVAPEQRADKASSRESVLGWKSSSHITESYDHINEKWPYCQSDDHRLWNEHLRNLIPVLPYETALGGIALQDQREQAVFANAIMHCESDKGVTKNNVNDTENNNLEEEKCDSNSENNKLSKAAAAATPSAETLASEKCKECWSLAPNFVPTYCETEMTPPAFAQQQPRTPSDLPLHWWSSRENNTQTQQQTITTLALPTQPLIPEHDPDEYPAESYTDAIGNVVEEVKREGHTIDIPNLHRLYPVSITDGGRRLTPLLSSTRGYKYVTLQQQEESKEKQEEQWREEEEELLEEKEQEQENKMYRNYQRVNDNTHA